MPFDPRAVANRMLSLGRDRRMGIDPMKLQKLLYYAHGWHLALQGQPLLDRAVQAWRFGPVLPDVYRAFRSFGMHAITAPARYAAIEPQQIVLERYRMPEGSPSVYADRVLRRVLEEYGAYTAVELSAMTHADGTPWAEAWAQSAGRRFVPIPDATMTAYFHRILQPVAA